jgi:hypothetical protein
MMQIRYVLPGTDLIDPDFRPKPLGASPKIDVDQLLACSDTPHLGSEVGLAQPLDRDTLRNLHSRENYGYGEKESSSVSGSPKSADHVRRDQEYLLMKGAFDLALERTLQDFSINSKSELVTDGLITGDHADRLLSNFRAALLEIDPIRVESAEGSVKKAKRLNRQEQLMFRVLLQNELGLDFTTEGKRELNARNLFFTVPAGVLSKIKPTSPKSLTAAAA